MTMFALFLSELVILLFLVCPLPCQSPAIWLYSTTVLLLLILSFVCNGSVLHITHTYHKNDFPVEVWLSGVRCGTGALRVWWSQKPRERQPWAKTDDDLQVWVLPWRDEEVCVEVLLTTWHFLLSFFSGWIFFYWLLIIIQKMVCFVSEFLSVVWRLQVDVPWWSESVYPDQLVLRLWCCAHWSQHLCSGRPGHGSVNKNRLKQQSCDEATGVLVFDVFPVRTRRHELRLHPWIPPQHRDVASHQTYVIQRPLQNRLRRPAYRQLPTVPPSVEPGHVPNQSLIPGRQREPVSIPHSSMFAHWYCTCCTSGFRDLIHSKY